MAQQPAQTGQPQQFAHPSFSRTWDRTDRPVASGQVKRSWYWGPTPNSGPLREDYAEGEGGMRLVQYFDKSRMEINNAQGDPNSPFFVTNGLLTVELISGKVQVGNSRYVDRYPADIPLASDPDDPNAPTYLSFQPVSNTPLGDRPAPSQVGQPAILTITRGGQVGEDATKSSYPLVNYVYFEPITRHNIPEAIWTFLNETGPVYNPAGQVVNARLSDPWFYATGYPISEPYWARVKVAGQQQDVLIQAFERRVVTYLPNGVPGFKVQMGNIGQHYYDWRYKDAGRPANFQPSPTPAAGGPTTTPTRPAGTPTSAPAPVADCSGIPDSLNMTVTPNCGPGGTTFRFEGRGFKPNEDVGVYITLPDQSVFGAPEQYPADPNGNLSLGLRTINDPRVFTPGIWAITMEGIESKAKAIGYWKITGPGPGQPTATPDPALRSCEGIPPSQNTSIRPSNCAPAGTTFLFIGSGFQPGENVGVYITDPDQAVFGAPEQFQARSDGTLGIQLDTDSSFPAGIWAITMEGVSSKSKAIGYFKITPP